jgi:hypothetical protein
VVDIFMDRPGKDKPVVDLFLEENFDPPPVWLSLT